MSFNINVKLYLNISVHKFTCSTLKKKVIFYKKQFLCWLSQDKTDDSDSKTLGAVQEIEHVECQPSAT